MAITDKLKTIAKGIFASSDGAAVAKPYGSAQNPQAGPIGDLTGYLSAMPPLPAMGPSDYEIRKRDFRIAENLDYIPGNGKFPTLRGLADRWNVLRTIIDTKKDLMATVPWSIKLDPEEGQSDQDARAASASDPVVAQLTEFFRKPDSVSTWFMWLKEFLEEVYVLDAGCIQVVRDSKGKICALPIVAGDTINRVIDDRGWTPSVPVDGIYPEAYQQVLAGGGAGSEGVPQRNMTIRDLVYCMRNPRPAQKYGQSSVEKIALYAMTGIYADIFIKEYYTSGNQPPGIMVLSGMPPEKIEEYEKKWNAVYAGNLSTKRRISMISAGPGDQKNVQYIPTKEPLLKSDIYLDFIRFACAEFSIPSVPFEKPMNRASAEESGDQATEAGLMPDLTWLAEIMNKIIKDPLYFNCPNYSFVFGERRSVNAKDAADVDKTYVGSAIETINEVRKKLGMPPSNEPNADKLGTMTVNNGWTPLNSDDYTALTKKLTAAKPKPAPQLSAAPNAPPAPGKGKKAKQLKKAASNHGKVLLARHGATKNDAPGDDELVSGQDTVPLDADGVAEAGQLAEQLKGQGITAIHASTTTRAAQTARIVGTMLGVPVTDDKDLDAPDYPELVGRTVGDTKAQWKQFQANPSMPMGEGGETFATLKQRSNRALESAQAVAAKGKNVLMVTHSRNIEILTGTQTEDPGSFQEV